MRCLTATEIDGTISARYRMVRTARADAVQRHDSSRRRLCVRALMIALACTVPATFLYAQVGADKSIDTLAKELLTGIIANLPAGSSVADVSIGLRPLSVDPSGPSRLPDDVRDDLSERLLDALVNADERVALRTRELIIEVYGTLEEYFHDEVTLRGLLEGAQADVEIFCGTELKTGGVYRIDLSCTAELLTEATDSRARAGPRCGAADPSVRGGDRGLGGADCQRVPDSREGGRGAA